MRKLNLMARAALVALCFSLLPATAAMDQGDKKFEVTGEVRFRGDAVNNPHDFQDNPDGTDDTGLTWPWRARAGIHGSFTRNVSAHVEFQNFGVAGDGSNGVQALSGSSASGNETQLYQGWVELGDIGGTTFDLRLGRQELVFGNEMLMGDNDFYNGTNHDGARAGWQYKKWSLDTWYTRTTDDSGGSVTPFPSTNPSGDNTFWGAYAVFKAPKKVGFDAYLMVQRDNSPGTDEERDTIGGRVYSKWDSNWTWWAELALQTGEFDTGLPGGTTDISANGFEGELGYQWRKAKIRPRVHGRYSMFTGRDDDPDENEAFDPLFQDTHGRYGLFDLFTPVNLNVLEVGVSWNGKEDRHVFGANYLMFTSNEETVGGVDVNEDDLGTELDLFYNYQYSKNVMIQAAIAQFAPGDQFDTGGPGAADSMPGVAASSDDSASRVYANTRIRW